MHHIYMFSYVLVCSCQSFEIFILLLKKLIPFFNGGIVDCQWLNGAMVKSSDFNLVGTRFKPEYQLAVGKVSLPIGVYVQLIH